MRSTLTLINRNKTRVAKAAAIGLIAAAITGCSGVGEVKPENRATSGQFDGPWLVKINKAAAIQYVQGWNMNCGNMAGEFYVAVRDGMLEIRDRNDNYTTPVAEDGRFKLILPLGDVSKESGSSGIAMSNGDTKIILRGSLKAVGGSGHITYGIAEMGYGGCTAKTDFKRMGPPSNKAI